MRKFTVFVSFTFLSLFVAACPPALCQPEYEWVKYYGGESGGGLKDVFATQDEGYAMTGWTHVEQYKPAIWLLVTDEKGEQFIDKTYFVADSISQSTGSSLVQTDAGGYVIGGQYDVNGLTYFVVLKTDTLGDLVWWYDARPAQWCHAVIELKDGNIVACGQMVDGNGIHPYAVMLNSGGEFIWDSGYNGTALWAVREVENGLVFAGSKGAKGWLLKTDFDGQHIWDHTNSDSGGLCALVTRPEGGFAAGGGSQRVVIATMNDDGEEQWSQTYNRDWPRNGFGLTRLFDGNYVLVGTDQGNHTQTALIMQVDSDGQEQWEQYDAKLPNNKKSWEYCSVIQNKRYDIMVAGMVFGPSGVLIKILPETSPPVIIDTIPNITDMALVRGDSVFFDVTAEDAQGDSLYYYWSLDADTISTDTCVTITFNDLGDHLLQLWVSDGQFQDSCFWTIHVKEVMVTGYEPQELRMNLLRDSEAPFKASCRAGPGDDVDLAWTLDGDIISQVDSALIQFSKSGNHAVKFQASTGEYADTVRWNVAVNAVLVTGYEPDSLVLSLKRHAVIPFKIVATASPGDTVSYRWYWVESNETIATTDTATVQFEVPRRWQLRGEAECGNDRAWQTWAVDVKSIIADWFPIATTLAPSQDTTLTFSIVPSDTSSDSLRNRWTLDGDSVGAESASVLLLTAPARHTIKGYLWDGAEVDSVVWEAYPPNEIKESRINNQEFGLSGPYPNPFNQSSVVSYQLSVAGKVNLSLYDISGRLVETLVDGWQSAGEHRVLIGQAGTPAPPALPTGIYIIRLQAGREVMTRKAVVIR